MGFGVSPAACDTLNNKPSTNFLRDIVSWDGDGDDDDDDDDDDDGVDNDATSASADTFDLSNAASASMYCLHMRDLFDA